MREQGYAVAPCDFEFRILHQIVTPWIIGTHITDLSRAGWACGSPPWS